MRKLLPVAFLVLAANGAAFAQTEPLKPAYDFSLSRDEKIKLAQSAAPPEVSTKATIYILEKTGYSKVQDGTNGFSCLVDRQTPFNSEPTCFDAAGSATTLLTRIFVEDQRANGKSEDEIKSALNQGYKSGKFKAPGKPGIVYMLSDSTMLLAGDKLVHAPPHLMFYAPYATAADLGSPPPSLSMPRIIREGQPDAYIIVFPASAQSHPAH
jgi:hypothetical protein